MRTIWKFPLPLRGVNSFALSLEMPVGAQIVRVDVQLLETPGPGRDVEYAPIAWALVDTDAERETRTFRLFGTGDEVPDHASHIGTFFDGPYVWHVLDVTPREPDVPATPDLPDAERSHFVLLWRDGFRPRDDKAWIAPNDEPLTYEQVVAIGTLQEYGYGPIAAS